jgi:hypothetical protein
MIELLAILAAFVLLAPSMASGAPSGHPILIDATLLLTAGLLVHGAISFGAGRRAPREVALR